MMVTGIVTAICISPILSFALPTVTNEVTPLSQSQSVIISFIQYDLESISDCHYNLFAAKKKKHLETLPGKGLSIATFENHEPQVKIIAGPMGVIKRSKVGPLKKHSVKVYLRTLISCPSATNGQSEIISFSVPTKKKGLVKSVEELLLHMKFHMKYYKP